MERRETRLKTKETEDGGIDLAQGRKIEIEIEEKRTYCLSERKQRVSTAAALIDRSQTLFVQNSHRDIYLNMCTHPDVVRIL